MRDLDEDFCRSIEGWYYGALEENDPWSRCILLLLFLVWIIGILGNLATIFVFNHERMTKSYIISLLYWLAVCDFLELISFFVLVFLKNFYFEGIFKIFSNLIRGAQTRVGFNFLEKPEFYAVLLLFTQHNISILLNITLVFVQYLMTVHPFLYKQLFSGNRSTKWTVNGVLFVSIILSSFFLTSSLHNSNPLSITTKFNQSGNAYVAESYHGDISNANEVINSMYEDTMNRRDGLIEEFWQIYKPNFVKPSFVNRTKEFLHDRWNIHEENPYSLFRNLFLGEVQLWYIYFGSWKNPAFIIILSSIMMRIGLLFVLLIASIGLIFGSIRARRIQRNLRGGSVSEITERVTNRMTNMTLLVVFIFSITEIPIVAYSLFMLPVNTVYVQAFSSLKVLYSSVPILRIYTYYSTLLPSCIYILAAYAIVLMLISLLFSSSYTVLCYLIMSAQYREILKHLLCKIFRSVKNFFSSNTQLTEIAVAYHRNLASNTP